MSLATTACDRELRRIHGLRPAGGDVHKLDIAHHRRCLVEGGYRFTDYLRLGAPLSLIAGTVVVTLVPRVWGFG